MKKENTQKIKLLKIMELLQKETDEDHPIPRGELCRRMEEQGIPCSLRVISEDIDTLNAFGFEVCYCQLGHQRGYYAPQQAFSIAELKILIDAVQAAGFISEEKTLDLVCKLAKLGGSHQAELLKSNLVHFNIRKHSNDAVCDNVAKFEEALRRQRKASFYYFDLNEKAERVYRREHGRYHSEPIALVYDSGYYYLLGHNTDPEKYGDTVTYRIDRMDDVVIEGEKISEDAKEQRKHLKGYTSRVFRMFGGPEEKITLDFDAELLGAVFDRFGERLKIRRLDDGRYSVTVNVQMSPTFRAWVYQFGEKMRIQQP